MSDNKDQLAQLLSDSQLNGRSQSVKLHLRVGPVTAIVGKFKWTPKQVRDFYETKLSIGELAVVKTTRNCNSATGWFTCLNCGATMANAYYSYPPHHSEHGGRIDFCPGCGAKITA